MPLFSDCTFLSLTQTEKRKNNELKMSYLPTIRPSMVRFGTKENQCSRAELARRHEESLYAKFKLITKQSSSFKN